ncbi:MAG: DUF998 domain-containing protein [Anaerolineae bacterium]
MPQGRSVQVHDTTARALLAAGALAGPVFTLAWLLEGATRADYDPLRHPVSSLAIGEWGWTQSAAFLVTGLLTLAYAFGLQRRLRSLEGPVWGPRLIAAIAVGLLGAGLFITDPMNGYPPGTPPLPLQYSVPGRLHRLFSALVFLGLPAACFVFGRFFTRRGARRWANYSVVTGVAFLALFVVTSAGFAQVPGLVDYAGLFQRLTLTVGWAWLTLLALWLMRSA